MFHRESGKMNVKTGTSFLPLALFFIAMLFATPSQACRCKDIFGSEITAVKCRVCHEKLFESGVTPLADWLEMRNPDKHHLKVGTPVTRTTGPPGAVLGDVYDCTSCHRFTWDAETSSYQFDIFRDCLYCHPPSTVDGPPMSNRHPMRGLPCNVCHGITIYDDGSYEYTGGSGGMGGGMGGRR